MRGANVTIPHKEGIIRHLDRLDECARDIGAVNTVLNRDGKLWGYNTDVTGFIGALIPESYVAGWVGGDSLASNFAAAFVGALWYFATLTEIPITEMLMRLGMGKGPALALLLAGPALSLPSMLVIYKIIGFRKTLAFCALTVGLSTLVGWLFGMFVV
jgi:uncharacterized membrane protein YraQ (UPF0718 family)